MLRPDPIGLAQARRPRQHRRIKLYADRFAKHPQRSLGILQNISRIDHRRDFARCSRTQ